MTASRRFVVWGTVPVGSVAGGAVASVIGLRETTFRSIGPVPALEADA